MNSANTVLAMNALEYFLPTLSWRLSRQSSELTSAVPYVVEESGRSSAKPFTSSVEVSESVPATTELGDLSDFMSLR
jgi:hypothetical protein